MYADIWLPLLLSLPILAIAGLAARSLFKPDKVSLIHIYLLAFALQFILMPTYALVTEWIQGYWEYSETELLSVYFCLYVFLGGVTLISWLHNKSAKHYRKGISLPLLLRSTLNKINARQSLMLFIVIMGLLISFNIAFGYTYYGSGTLERNLSVPYPLVVLKSIFSILAYGLVGWGAVQLSIGYGSKLLGVILLISIVLLDIYARRNYMSTLMALLFVKLLIDHKRVSFRQIIIFVGIIFFIAKVFFPFLYVFRILTNDIASANNQTTDLSKAYRLSSTNQGYLVSKGQGHNLTFRTNQISRNLEFMRYPGPEHRYMNGLLLATQIASVVPRALNPAKIQTTKLLSPEGIVLLFYGKKNMDIADNLPLYGFLDFGYWGAFGAGILQGIFLILFEWLSYRLYRIGAFLGLSAIMCAFYTHLNIEYPYTQELSLIRELLILLIICGTTSVLWKWIKSVK